MNYQHSNVYIVRIVDSTRDDVSTWFAGPYGGTRAEQKATELQEMAHESTRLRSRECFVEPLFSDDDCLSVSGYNRATSRSLQ